MTKRCFSFFSIVGVFLIALTQISYAQSTPAVCVNPTSADIATACAEYEREAKVLQEQQAKLNTLKQKSGVLQKDVNAVVSQINSTQSKIRERITAIGTLSQEINKKVKAIDDLESELDRERSSLKQLIKRTNEIDQKGATYVLLSSQSVSDFYKDLDDFYSIKQSLSASLDRVKTIKATTEKQKEDLQDKQYQAMDAKSALESQKSKLAVTQKQAQQLLSQSKTEEQKQASLVAEQQKKVAAIQSRLFSFAGGNTKAIPFKEAYAHAVEASKVTGVRPAFVLAILTQESNLGKNVGTCNRAGDPPSKGWRNIMKPDRDQQPFLRITGALGLNPDVTPVSCPFGGGWGGAMGPAQFIPSTWESVQKTVAASLGKSSANPWIARDAIMASSTYLKMRGGTGGEVNERNAACRYYSGRACDGKKPANSFYGNNVMALARGIQADIDYLEEYGVSRR